MTIVSELHEQSNIGTSVPIIRISSFSKYVLLIVAIMIPTNIAIEFNIPIYRQVMGILLLLLPGLLFMRLLNPRIKDTAEKLVLTFGICISALIFSGLTLCLVSQSIGLDRPLSIESILITFDSICILFLGLLSRKKYSIIELSLPKNILDPYNKLFLLIAILIPTWSFWGIQMMNRYSYNALLLGLFIFVSIVILLVSIYHKKIISNIYPIIIFSISISFVLLYPMRSDHLLGMDIHSEYYLYQELMKNLNWQLIPSDGYELLRPCVSISLLPMLLQSIIQVNPERLYILYIPIFFSITPTIIYIIAKHYLSKNEAFLSSIAFISYYSFFSASYYSRATLALLFFALFIMVLFNDTLFQYQKSILLLLFSISMIFTHYSSTFILIIIFGTSSIIMDILSKEISFKRKFKITLVLTIFVFAFFWYSMVTEGVFNISLRFVKLLLTMDNFHANGARSGMVDQLGGDIPHNYISELSLINTWLFLFLIGLGILGLILRSRKYYFESKGKNRYVFLKKEFEPEFVIITVLCIIILALTLILPLLSTGYDINRIYFQTSVILSIVFIVGGKYAGLFIEKIKSILKIRNKDKNRNDHIEADKLGNIITLVVLIPHLLFVTNVPIELTGKGESIIFNSVCPAHDRLYMYDSDVSCINWWDSNRMENHNISADYFGAVQIKRTGNIVDWFKITEKPGKIPETRYTYLRESNIVKNRIYYSYDTKETKEIFNFNEYPLNKIYSAPATILYRNVVD